MHSGCPEGGLPSYYSLAARPSLFLSLRLTRRLWQEEEVPSLRGLFTDQLKYRLTAGQSAWASPHQQQLHVPKRGVQNQDFYLHSLFLLCSRSSSPGGNDLYSKQIEKTVEEQLVMALVSPKQLCKIVYAINCTIGGESG